MSCEICNHNHYTEDCVRCYLCNEILRKGQKLFVYTDDSGHVHSIHKACDPLNEDCKHEKGRKMKIEKCIFCIPSGYTVDLKKQMEVITIQTEDNMVVCNNCGANGPHEINKKSAVSSWNYGIQTARKSEKDKKAIEKIRKKQDEISELLDEI